MNVLNDTEVGMVSGGEILVSPGQLGIALTDNTLVVITGLVEAQTAMSVFGAFGFAAGVGVAVGGWLVEYTDIENVLGGWAYNFMNC